MWRLWTRILVEFGPPLVVLEEEFFILRTYISLASSVLALHRSTTHDRYETIFWNDFCFISLFASYQALSDQALISLTLLYSFVRFCLTSEISAFPHLVRCPLPHEEWGIRRIHFLPLKWVGWKMRWTEREREEETCSGTKRTRSPSACPGASVFRLHFSPRIFLPHARSLRHSTLIPPLSLLRTTESIRPDSFGVNGQGPNSIGLIFA